jgi:hypothetical protein
MVSADNDPLDKFDAILQAGPEPKVSVSADDLKRRAESAFWRPLQGR